MAEAFFARDTATRPMFYGQTHSVTLPESFKESVRVWLRGGWLRFGPPAGIGGTPAPATVRWSINEFLVGGQPAAFFYLAGPPSLEVLYSEGNEQQRHWAALAIDRNWGGTMVLTEPDAGSDVGAGRTRRSHSPTAPGTSTA